MLKSCAVMLIVVLALGFRLSAAQAPPAQARAAADVSEGRRLFAQKCSICHLPATRRSEPYGPRLSKAQVTASEKGVTDTIRNGGVRMPGFQYALAPGQIAAIVAFLKTVETPTDRIVLDAPSP